MTVASARSWWRRNRLALAVLPVVVALVAVTSASRLVIFWWPTGWHRAVSANLNEAAALTDDADHAIEVTVTGAAPADTWYDAATGDTHDIQVPAGIAVWQVDIDFAVDPDANLLRCTIHLVDTAGRSALYDNLLITSPRLDSNPCLPPLEFDDDGEVLPPPPEYSREVLMVTSPDFTPAAVTLGIAEPVYLEVRLEPDSVPPSG